MTAKVARGGSARGRSRPKVPARGGARKGQQAMLDTLPLPAETVRRVSGWLLAALLLAFVLAVLVAFRVPQMAGIALGETVGAAGFTVKRVDAKGLNRMRPMQVYDVADSQMGRAMPLVDLDGTRQRLLRYGWVKDARVSRRFPDTLVVDIVERTPAAIWQHNQRLSLIDRDGIVLDRVDLAAMPDLPLVIGPAANQHAGELSRLLQAAPRVRQLLAGATWVGGRRWDLRFQTGETLALPEGPDSAATALVKFETMDSRNPLLGRNFVRFDMRIPGKITVRVSREPGSIVPDMPDAAPEPVAAPPANIPQAAGDAPPTSQTI